MRKVVVLTLCLFNASCAVQGPVQVENKDEHIGHLTRKMAQSYNAGVAKVVNSLLPVQVTEFETLREADFKVRTSPEKAVNLYKSFAQYCSSKGGLEYPPDQIQLNMTFSGCARNGAAGNEILFVYWIHEAPASSGSKINCYSVLVTENRDLISMKEFSHYANLRFETVLENGFFEANAC